MKSLYCRRRFPPEIISLAVWLYYCFTLSFRDVEDLLAERGVSVSCEAIRSWCSKFGPSYARTLRKRQGRRGDIWHADELFITIRGERLWRAVDQDGDRDSRPAIAAGRVLSGILDVTRTSQDARRRL